MSKVFAALQRLELEDDVLAADFTAEAQAILQQPISIPENQNREMAEPIREMAEPIPRAAARADELPLAPRVVPVRVTADSPLLPFEPSSQSVGEQYRIVRTKIVQHPMSPRVIAISSIDPGDGKTTTAINVAAALALKSEIKVLLVDCDLRRGQIGARLGIPNNPGLADILSGARTLNEAVVQVKQFPSLHVLVAGTMLANPAEVLDSPHWRLLMQHLREQFDYVILDTPPIGLVTDSELIHQVSDGVILVVRPDYTTRSRCVSALAAMSAKGLLGVVLNCVPKPYLRQSNSYYGYSSPPKA